MPCGRARRQPFPEAGGRKSAGSEAQALDESAGDEMSLTGTARTIGFQLATGEREWPNTGSDVAQAVPGDVAQAVSRKGRLTFPDAHTGAAQQQRILAAISLRRAVPVESIDLQCCQARASAVAGCGESSDGLLEEIGELYRSSSSSRTHGIVQIWEM